jgi:hypothetical protein
MSEADIRAIPYHAIITLTAKEIQHLAGRLFSKGTSSISTRSPASRETSWPRGRSGKFCERMSEPAAASQRHCDRWGLLMPAYARPEDALIVCFCRSAEEPEERRAQDGMRAVASAVMMIAVPLGLHAHDVLIDRRADDDPDCERGAIGDLAQV